MSQGSRNNRKFSSAQKRLAVTVLAGACLVAGASTAMAGATSRTITYKVTVKQGVLAKGRTVNVRTTLTHAQRDLASWWSKPTVSGIVRDGVNANRHLRYSSHGYRCKPLVEGASTRFTCTRRGGDVPTLVKLTFAMHFATRLRAGESPADEYPIVVTVTAPASKSAALEFDHGVLDISDSPNQFADNAPSRLVFTPKEIVIVAGTAPLTATLSSTVAPHGATLDGQAQVGPGVTMKISLNGLPAVTVNGAFDLPLH